MQPRLRCSRSWRGHTQSHYIAKWHSSLWHSVITVQTMPLDVQESKSLLKTLASTLLSTTNLWPRPVTGTQFENWDRESGQIQ